jgi:hypothetical protein
MVHGGGAQIQRVDAVEEKGRSSQSRQRWRSSCAGGGGEKRGVGLDPPPSVKVGRREEEWICVALLEMRKFACVVCDANLRMPLSFCIALLGSA